MRRKRKTYFERNRIRIGTFNVDVPFKFVFAETAIVSHLNYTFS